MKLLVDSLEENPSSRRQIRSIYISFSHRCKHQSFTLIIPAKNPLQDLLLQRSDGDEDDGDEDDDVFSDYVSNLQFSDSVFLQKCLF